MEADDKQQLKKQAALLADLRSGNDVKVLAALNTTADEGTGEFVLPLLELFRDAQSNEVKNKASELLSSLKVSDAEDVLIEALEDDSFRNMRGAILGFMWSSGFQGADAVDTIVGCALEGDFMTAVEAMTLIDSMTKDPDEEALYQALLEIRSFLDKHKESGHEVYDIALSIFQILARFERDRPLL